MRFSFIGTFNLDRDNDKNIRRGKTKTGNEYVSISPSVLEKQNNRGRCELFGMKSDVILTSNQNNEKIEIKWKDRFDADVVKNVADYRKNVVKIGSERKEFISSFDAIEYVLDNLEMLNGKRVCVTGRSEKDFYNGQARDRFVIQNILQISDDDKRKNGLTGTDIVYWNKDGIDATDFKTDKRIYLNGYTSEYIREERANKYVEGKFVLDCSRLDLDTEKHVSILRAKLIEIGMDYKDGKIVNTMKKGYAVNEFRLRIVNGAEEVEFSIDDCNEKQRLYIELGLNTLEDFRPRGSLFGNWITEYRIKGPTFLGDYIEGIKYIEDKPDEFEEQIYVPLVDEKVEDVFEEDMNPPEPVEDEDIDALFDGD